MTNAESNDADGGPHARIYQAYVSSGGSGLDPKDAGDIAPRIPYFRRLVRTHFPTDRKCSVLDLGCGYGALLYVAKQEGYRNLLGVDASGEQVESARKLGLGEVSLSDIFTFLRDQPSNGVDVVITFDVLEHLTKRELISLIDEVHRVLASGGRWIIHVPNGESPFFGRIRYGDFTHESAFTQMSLSTLLKACNFQDIRCFEDTPAPHGVKSFVRLVLWKALRAFLRFYILVETGQAGNCIFSQCMLAVATPVKQRTIDLEKIRSPTRHHFLTLGHSTFSFHGLQMLVKKMLSVMFRIIGHQHYLRRGRVRLIRTVFNYDTSDEQEFDVDFFGLRYSGSFNNILDWHVYFFGCYSAGELNFIRIASRILREREFGPLTLLDIGANVGQHSLFASLYYDTVHAVEPLDEVRAELERKILRNATSNINVHSVGFGENDENRCFHVPKGANTGQGSFQVPPPGSEVTRQIRVANGDAYLRNIENADRINFIKIDVEGFEKSVLTGLTSHINADRPIIMMELDDRSKAAFGSEEALRGRFYEGHIIFELKETSTDGRFVLLPLDYGREMNVGNHAEIVVIPSEIVSRFEGLRSRALVPLIPRP